MTARSKSCDGGTPAGHGGRQGGAAPVIRVVDCGPPQVVGQVRSGPGDVCGQVRNLCDVPSAVRLPKDPKITTTATQQRNADGTWTLAGIDCVVRAAAPHVTAVLVMREVRKLVPHPKVGIAPPGGATLVNIQTLLWAETPPDQSLGTVTLIGHQVTLQVHVAQVDWNFGDGQRDATTDPERRYDPAAGCKTVNCPGYWGHVYVTTGAMTVSATVTWSGRYRVDAAPGSTFLAPSPGPRLRPRSPLNRPAASWCRTRASIEPERCMIYPPQSPPERAGVRIHGDGARRGSMPSGLQLIIEKLL